MPDDINIAVSGVCMYDQVRAGHGKYGANVFAICAAGDCGENIANVRQYISAQGVIADIMDVIGASAFAYCVFGTLGANEARYGFAGAAGCGGINHHIIGHAAASGLRA